MRDKLFTPLPSSCQFSSSSEQVLYTKLIELSHALPTPGMWNISNVCLVLMAQLYNPGTPQSFLPAGQLKVLSDHRSREGLTRSWCNCSLADFTDSRKLQSINSRELCCPALHGPLFPSALSTSITVMLWAQCFLTSAFPYKSLHPKYTNMFFMCSSVVSLCVVCYHQTTGHLLRRIATPAPALPVTPSAPPGNVSAMTALMRTANTLQVSLCVCVFVCHVPCVHLSSNSVMV